VPLWNEWTEHYGSLVTSRFKQKRMQLFLKSCVIKRGDTILDLGSEDGSYMGRYYPFPEDVVLADIEEEPMREGKALFGFRGYKVIKPNEGLPFDDGEFDVVWCNSVIEHVTVSRDEMSKMTDSEFRKSAEAHQALFAKEIERIGKRYFVQTPSLHFPIESHSWIPLVQYLPQPKRWNLSRRLKNTWIKMWRADFHLYEIKRFRRDFPTATQINIERAFGLPKSLIAIRGPK